MYGSTNILASVCRSYVLSICTFGDLLRLYCGPPPPIFILTDGMALPWRRSDGGQVSGPTSRGQGVSPYLWLTRSVVLWLVYATDNFSLYNIGFFQNYIWSSYFVFFMWMVIKWCLWLEYLLYLYDFLLWPQCVVWISCNGVWIGIQEGC